MRPIPTDFDSLLRTDEGEEPFAYKDSLGYTTLGVGRNIDKRGGKGLSPAEITFLLDNDKAEVRAEAEGKFPWFSSLDPVRQAVIMSAIFILESRLEGFPKFLAACASSDWPAASTELKNSKWFLQAPARVGRFANMLITGKWE